MSLYAKWEELINQERSQKEYDDFWKVYLEKEMRVYQYILENNEEVLNGELSELGKKFDMDPVTFAGFLSGINSSLKRQIDLDSLKEDTFILLEVDFEKLYYNMLDAKASWLYTLPEWENVLSLEKRKEITKEFNSSKIIRKENKIGRNDPCPCGSGKKYKKCCGQ